MGNRSRARRLHLIAIALLAAAGAVSAGAVSAGAAGSGAAREELGPPTQADLAAASEEFIEEHPPPPSGEPAPQRTHLRAKAGAILGDSRVVSYYGAPQLTRTVIGRYSPAEAGRRLLEQAAAYEGPRRRPVIPAIDLIGVIATADAGADGKYRFRQAASVIQTYLDRARRIGARLMLDVQPGRARPIAELKALRGWLRRPDVDLAIDPEWNVGPSGYPGRTQGSIRAKQLNRLSAWLQRLVRRRALPPKVLAVHQFHSRSVRRRGRVRQRRDVDVTLNFDGIGSPAAKEAGYVNLSVPHLHDGFSVFYSLDRPLMRPGDVLRLRPQPAFVLYQ